ncbi:hypothetical protein LCGC14_3061280 [marine sediment metagenome]|uniref:Uncharacterized protein n=1 Tax=marine sediment metagenome TaxID=412755 RepID=A0A0F8WJD4_9ZZZZ
MGECKHEFMPARNIRIHNAVVCVKCQKFADAIALEKRVKELEGYTKCSRCGDYFNKKDLSRVLAHEECPVMSVNYESKRIK